jgi:thioredoxin 1
LGISVYRGWKIVRMIVMAEGVIEINQDQFEDVIKNNPKLVVDCWADWCGPCRMMAPTIDKLAKEYEGKVAFGKVNTDQNQKLVQQYRVMAIPTLLFFKDGQLVDQSVGLVPKEEIEAVMKKRF